MRKLIIVPIALAIILFGVYETLIKYDNDFQRGRMRETPAVRPHEKMPFTMVKGVVPVEGGEAIYRLTKGDELASPLHGDYPTTIEQGKTLYFTFCVQCHGKHHDGNGTVGQSFSPLPTDLRSKTVQSLPEGALFKTISYGIPDGRQPPLASTIAIRDRWQIIAYVKSLGIRE
jgi:mono/diheme cytochrome c family protein